MHQRVTGSKAGGLSTLGPHNNGGQDMSGHFFYTGPSTSPFIRSPTGQPRQCEQIQTINPFQPSRCDKDIASNHYFPASETARGPSDREQNWPLNYSSTSTAPKTTRIANNLLQRHLSPPGKMNTMEHHSPMSAKQADPHGTTRDTHGTIRDSQGNTRESQATRQAQSTTRQAQNTTREAQNTTRDTQGTQGTPIGHRQNMEHFRSARMSEPTLQLQFSRLNYAVGEGNKPSEHLLGQSQQFYQQDGLFIQAKERSAKKNDKPQLDGNFYKHKYTPTGIDKNKVEKKMGLLGNNKLPNINGHTLSPKSKMKQDCNGMQEGQHQSQLTQSLQHLPPHQFTMVQFPSQSYLQSQQLSPQVQQSQIIQQQQQQQQQQHIMFHAQQPQLFPGQQKTQKSFQFQPHQQLSTNPFTQSQSSYPSSSTPPSSLSTSTCSTPPSSTTNTPSPMPNSGMGFISPLSISHPFVQKQSEPKQSLSDSHHQQRRKWCLNINSFQKMHQLGTGKYGKVYLAREKSTGFLCALKIIDKKLIEQEDIVNQFIREIKIQLFMHHPHIIKLYGFFHDRDHIYLILELATGGQLLHHLKAEPMPETRVACIIRQVCEAISVLHACQVIHRDIKPENVVLHDSVVKLCDFGWSVHQDNGMRTTFCGTPLYVCPEILKGNEYDEKVDIWSMGIMTYEMLVGENPFKISTEEELIKIVKDLIMIPSYVYVSKEARDFLDKCLKKKPSERVTAKQLLGHEFLTKVDRDKKVLL